MNPPTGDPPISVPDSYALTTAGIRLSSGKVPRRCLKTSPGLSTVKLPPSVFLCARLRDVPRGHASAASLVRPRWGQIFLVEPASSIVLNLSEGSAKTSAADRRRFYEIALGSTRECEAIVTLLGRPAQNLVEPIDRLARHLYKLVKALK